MANKTITFQSTFVFIWQAAVFQCLLQDIILIRI